MSAAAKPASTFRVLGFVPWPRRLLVVGGLVLSSFVELLGLTMVVPLLSLAARPDYMKAGFGQFIGDQLGAIGLPSTLEWLLVFFLVLITVKAVLTVAVMKYVADVVSAVSQNVRLHLARNLVHVKWSYFVRQPVGRLTNIMGHEANALGETFYMTANFLAAALHIAAYIAIAALLSWELALVCLGVGCAMFAWFGRLVTGTRAAARRNADQVNSLAANFGDTITSIRPIKAMGRQARFAQLFEADTERAGRTMRAKVVSMEFASEIQEPVIALGLAAGFYVAISVWTMPFDQMVLLGFVLARSIHAVYGLQRAWHRVIVTENNFRQILQAIEETEAEREDLSGTEPPSLEREIALEGVSYSYGAVPALADVSLTLRAGEILALVGPSGSGKSTLTDIVLGLLRPDGGEVYVDGVPLGRLDMLKWRGMIGYVPQDLTLFHDSVLRNVTLGEPRFTEEDARQALADAGALEFVDRLVGGVHYDVGERGLGLSGGQRQRVSIARALVHRPRLLILDEATTALDPETERAICENIRALARARNLTILAISHQPRWAEMADRTIRLEHGRIVSVVERAAAQAADGGALAEIPAGAARAAAE